MKAILLTVAAATLLTSSLCAQAADLAPRSMAPAYAPVAVQQVYNWTGLYIGVNGGYGWGNQDPFNIITNRFDSFTTGLSGGAVGGTLGAQIQAGHVVLGLEADIDWADIKGSTVSNPTIGGVALGAVNAQTNIDWESTVRARVGYANNNWLFYGTGGLALLGAKTTLTPVSGGGTCGSIIVGCSGSNRQAGLALGGGVEYGFTPELSAKLEYLYISAASLEVSRHSEVRAGLNYRFGGM
ncbi:MAG: outer membrane beta-barrel protein [Xanthobacteraceae bacterium]